MAEPRNALVEFLAEHRGRKEQAEGILLRASIELADVVVVGTGLDLWTRILHELEHVRPVEERARLLAQLRQELPRAPVDAYEQVTLTPRDAGPGPAEVEAAGKAAAPAVAPDPVAVAAAVDAVRQAPADPVAAPEPTSSADAVATADSSAPEPTSSADAVAAADSSAPEEAAAPAAVAPPRDRRVETHEPLEVDDRARTRELASALAGALAILVSVVIWAAVSCLPVSADAALRVLVALGAGLVGGAITGRIKVAVAPQSEGGSGPLAGWKVEAVGGAAVSLLAGVMLFYVTPPSQGCPVVAPRGGGEAGLAAQGRPEGEVPPPKAPEGPSTAVVLSEVEPPVGMRLVEGGTLHQGSSRTEWEAAYRRCRTLPRQGWNPDHCSEHTWRRESEVHRERVLEPFFLDTNEVTVREVASWLTTRIEDGTVSIDDELVLGPKGVVWGQLGARAGAARRGRPDVPQWELTAEGDLEPAPDRGEHPAALVTWQLADAYCRDRGARLPSEREWEWAARGADRADYPWGDRAPSCADVVVDRVEHGECEAQPHGPAEIGSGAGDVSWAGVRDLGGSVAEWVADAYLDAGQAREGEDRCVAEPLPPDQPRVRACHVFKGGSWAWPRLFARAAGRSVGDTTPTRSREDFASRLIVFDDVGFRCAADLGATAHGEE